MSDSTNPLIQFGGSSGQWLAERLGLLVIATAIAALLARAMRRDSIYTAELRRRGIGWELTLEGRRLVE